MATITSTDRSRYGRWLVLAGLTALLLSLSRVFPVAAASTLTPSENPVIIAAPALTKTITLAWTLDTPQIVVRGTLTVTENGGGTVLNQALTSPSGSTPLTVTCGKSYDAKLRNADNVVVAQVTIVAQRPGQPPAPCESVTEPGPLKILKTNVTGHGTYVAVKAQTNKPASFYAEIGKKAPNSSGYFAAGDVVSGSFPVCCFTDWPLGKVFNLQPDTEYHWVIRSATAGEQAFKTGTVHTQKRRVEVTYTKIDMIDDSDDLSDCDCIFWFQAGSAPVKQVLDGSQGVATGITLLLQPNVVITVDDAPDSLPLRVEAYDYDCVSSFCLEFCVLVQHPNWGTGSGWNCGEWHTAFTTVSTVPTSSGNEAYTQSFQFKTWAPNHPLQFRAYGTYKVSYY